MFPLSPIMNRGQTSGFQRVNASTAAEASRKVLGQKRKLTESPVPAEHLQSPADFVRREFELHGLDVSLETPLTLTFLKPTEDMIASYKVEVIEAVRQRDIEALRKLHNDGESLQCCNRFGESLIHMACRRGYTDVVRFLVEEAKVSLMVRDDYGRTPLHDACWTPSPRFDLVQFIIEQVPELLCVKDVRGHTPLNYVRKEDWSVWRSFLDKHRPLLRPASKRDAAIVA